MQRTEGETDKLKVKNGVGKLTRCKSLIQQCDQNRRLVKLECKKKNKEKNTWK